MEEGTLARASARLFLSQAAASRLLANLEEEFDVRLFFREKKRLVPTPEGDLFYPKALRILASIDDIPSFFRQIENEAMVPLRIICHPRISHAPVAQAITRLSRRQPNLRFKLEVHPRRDLSRRIAEEIFDIGVSILPIPSEELEPELLYSSQIQVLLPKGHTLSSRRMLSTADLADIPYIAMGKNTLIRRMVDQELLEEGIRLDPVHEVSLGVVAYRLVIDGMGYTFADPVAIEPDLKPRLCFVPWKRTRAVDFGVFLPKGLRRHHAVDDFISCLKEQVRSE